MNIIFTDDSYKGELPNTVFDVIFPIKNVFQMEGAEQTC